VLVLVEVVAVQVGSIVTKTAPCQSVMAQLCLSSTPHKVSEATHWALSATRYGIIVVRYAKSPRRTRR
jgi:hypothetical protein